MAGLGIDGLVSGLNTTELIDQLMAVEANQQTLLKSKKTSTSSLVTALQTLNTKVASLATAATSAAAASSWQAVKATSSDTAAATATVGEGATPSTLTFRVDATAAAQSTMYTLPEYYDGTPSFTLTAPDGTTRTIAAASSNITDVLAAFNADGTGVKASALNVGTAAEPQYRLQLTGTETGAAHAFTLTADNPLDGSSLTTQSIRSAADAKITLWPGTDAESVVTSSTNTFDKLATGVSVTAVKAGTEPTTITVTRNDTALSSLASGLVNNLNTVLSEISSRTATSTSTADDGGTVVTGGLFSGNTTIRLLQQELARAGSASVGDSSAAQVGIVLNKDGTFTFDQETFTAAMNADPAKVQQVITSIAAGLEKVATAASDETKGTLTSQITTWQGEVDDLADRIASWDTRLTDRRAALVKTYAALEVSLQKLQSQSDWLTSQISQLNANNSN
ncbi:flagellar filament capping protein FliD [Cellulomonas denverensis]|uniref:Flagellar hook-associated protein 2 n=1 Tax=Cellulomonas denverensis TaxID=264297 RepID=A0A7X6KV61_9CELL|nr:flagellar filament capping protein FliD [Cellulomonas denverensis]NKY22866.1 flagellar filament capping protein FliD [Cellulomonas denverensis]GIG24062.1 flagellar hook-associated protein 2 [Cellulomonas denverensis]